jgi:hypothetical protein
MRNANAPRPSAPEIRSMAIVIGSRAPVFGTPGTVGIGVTEGAVTSTEPDVGPDPPLTPNPTIGVTVVEPDVAGTELGVSESVIVLPTGANVARSHVTARVTVEPAPTVRGEEYPNVFMPLTMDGALEFKGVARLLTLRTRQSARCDDVKPPPSVKLIGSDDVWMELPVPACNITSARSASGVPAEIRGVAFMVMPSDVPDGALVVVVALVVVCAAADPATVRALNAIAPSALLKIVI